MVEIRIKTAIRIQGNKSTIIQPKLWKLAGLVALVANLCVELALLATFTRSKTCSNLKVSVFREIPGHEMRMLPNSAVLVQVERRGGVYETVILESQRSSLKDKFDSYSPVEPNKVTHCSHCKVGHNVHTTSMNFGNGVDPVVPGSPMRVKYGKVERGVTWTKAFSSYCPEL